MIKEVALSCLNIPYLYGGKNPLTGMDCSGFVEWCLDSVGMSPPGVANAQALFDWFMKENKAMGTLFEAGSICFYGKSVTEISHVSIMINENQIIEAGGGDHTTISLAEAQRRGACVRIRPINHRKDVVMIIYPKYPDWVKP